LPKFHNLSQPLLRHQTSKTLSLKKERLRASVKKRVLSVSK